MKKHMLPLLLAAFFALSLAACNTQETGSSSQLESAQESSQLSSAPQPEPFPGGGAVLRPRCQRRGQPTLRPGGDAVADCVGGETFLADLATLAAAQEIASSCPSPW